MKVPYRLIFKPAFSVRLQFLLDFLKIGLGSYVDGIINNYFILNTSHKSKITFKQIKIHK